MWCTRTSSLSSQSDFQHLSGLLKEANAISADLQKAVSFRFALLTNTPYSPLPLSIITGTDMDIDPEDARQALLAYERERGRLRCGCGPVVAVEVKDGRHGCTHVWSIEKLK